MSGFKAKNRAIELANQALELDGPERDRLLENACVDDEPLRQAVDELLGQSTVQMSGQVTTAPGPSVEVGDPVETSLPSGRPDMIGPFKIVGVIGSGGMGRVYKGEQTRPIRRAVAIKVLQTAIPDRDQQLRFLAERQAMAQLTHSNIAQLFEAGTMPNGHPYFAMEFVQGKTLTQHADEHRLSIQQRLDLFMAVCEGVSYAHMKGILHRDLKPENIIVADYVGHPQPKIIDFGIAKAIDTPLTDEAINTGVVALGTLPYMSPEALEHKDGVIDLDFRSDLYALGIILYELLTGRRPYDERGKTMTSLVAEISAGSAKPPSVALRTTGSVNLKGLAQRRGTDVSALQRRLRGDLDWIVMKAIDVDRDRRYHSVADLAADIKRYLRFEPVLASPPTMVYRLKKFARRNRLITGAGVLAAVTLIVGIGSTAYGLIKSREAEAIALQQAQVAERRRIAAEEATDFLLDIFMDADPYRRESGARGEELTVQQLLDQSADRLLDAGLEDQPEIRLRIISALAGVYLRIGLTERAEALLNQAMIIRQGSRAEDDLNRVQMQRNLARLAEIRGDYELSERHLRDAYRVSRSLQGEDHPDVAATRTSLAKIILTQGNPERAEPLLREAMDSSARTVGIEHEYYVNAINSLALSHYAQGEYPEAEALFQQTIDHSLRNRDRSDPSIGVTMNNLAMVQVKLTKIDEAEITIRTVIDLFERSLPEGHWRVSNAKTVLAACFLAKGQLETAESLLLTHYPVVLEARGESSPYAAEIRKRLVLLYETWDRDADAARFRE